MFGVGTKNIFISILNYYLSKLLVYGEFGLELGSAFIDVAGTHDSDYYEILMKFSMST